RGGRPGDERHAQADDGAHLLRMQYGEIPYEARPPVVTDEDRRVLAVGVEQAAEVAREGDDVIGLHLRRCRASSEPAQVRREHAEARSGQRSYLVPPRESELWKAVAQD